MAAAQSYTEDDPRLGRGAGGTNEVLLLSHEGAVYPTTWEVMTPYFTEFFGTFILSMTFIYNYGVNKDPVWTATSNGLMVVSVVYAFFHISGANMNPSVTMSLLLTGRYTPRVAGRLCLAQVLGAITAAVVRSMFSNVYVDIGPMPGHTWRAVLLIELLYTAMLCFVYLNCAASMRNNPVGAPNGFVGLAVGFCFVAGGYASREISHVVMNSAIAVGLGVVDSYSEAGFSGTALGYFFADFMGAFIGTAAFRIVRPQEDNTHTGQAVKKEDTDSAKVAAEFIGTFFVIFTKALNRIGSQDDVGPEAWSVAAALTSMVYSLRGVSGGYFNPAVTLAGVLSGRGMCAPRVAIFYVVAQVFAAIAASSLFAAMNKGEGIQLTFASEISPGARMFGEALFSFLITYVVLAMTVPPPGTTAAAPCEDGGEEKDKGIRTQRQSDIAGFAYGACHTAGGFAIGQISGALLNPAVVLSFTGVDLFKGQVEGTVLLYIFYEVFGALVATGVFMITHAGLYRTGAEQGSIEDKEATA